MLPLLFFIFVAGYFGFGKSFRSDVAPMVANTDEKQRRVISLTLTLKACMLILKYSSCTWDGNFLHGLEGLSSLLKFCRNYKGRSDVAPMVANTDEKEWRVISLTLTLKAHVLLYVYIFEC